LCATDIVDPLPPPPPFPPFRARAALVGTLGEAMSGSPSSDDMSVSTLCSSLLDLYDCNRRPGIALIGPPRWPGRLGRSGGSAAAPSLLAGFFSPFSPGRLTGRFGLPAADPSRAPALLLALFGAAEPRPPADGRAFELDGFAGDGDGDGDDAGG